MYHLNLLDGNYNVLDLSFTPEQYSTKQTTRIVIESIVQCDLVPPESAVLAPKSDIVRNGICCTSAYHDQGSSASNTWSLAGAQASRRRAVSVLRRADVACEACCPTVTGVTTRCVHTSLSRPFSPVTGHHSLQSGGGPDRIATRNDSRISSVQTNALTCHGI